MLALVQGDLPVLNWARSVLAVAFILVGCGAAQADVMVRHLPRARSTDFCVQAAAAMFQAAGYSVWAPKGASVWAIEPGKQNNVGIVCSHEDGPLLILDTPLSLRGVEAETAAKLIQAVSNAISSKDGPAPSYAGPWFDGGYKHQYTPTEFAVRRLAVEGRPRCPVLTEVGLRPLGYDIGSRDPDARESGGSTATHRLAVNCEREGELVVIMSFHPREVFDQASSWAKALAGLRAALPAAEQTPGLSFKLVDHGGPPAGCVPAAVADFRSMRMPVSQKAPDVVIAEDDRGPWFVQCAPHWALLARPLTDVIDLDDRSEGLKRAYLSPPAPQSPAPLSQDVFRPSLGVTLRPRTIEALECRDAAMAALTSASYSTDTYHASRTSQMQRVDGERRTFAMSASVFCAADRYGVLVSAGRGAPQLAAELQRLEDSFLTELGKPQWRIEYVSGMRVQMPRRPVTTSNKGPDGLRTTVTARFDGLEYVGWSLAPPADTQPAADVALESARQHLADAGASITQSQRAPFKGQPSLVVWFTRGASDGALRRGAARYVAFKGKLYGIEVTYPDGRNPEAEMAKFSESLSIDELY